MFLHLFPALLLIAMLPRVTAFSLRQENICVVTSSSSNVRKVLQINGTADDLVTFSVCSLSQNYSISQFSLQTESSSSEVLQISGSDSALDLQISQDPLCLNVSASFSFDSMVGITVFTLSAIHSSLPSASCSLSIQFVVTGITVFETVSLNSSLISRFQRTSRLILSDGDPSIAYIIRSGPDNSFTLDYRDVLNTTVRNFAVRIQFPDGSDQSSRSVSALVDSLQDVSTSAIVDATSPVRFDQDACSKERSDSALLGSSPVCGAVLSSGAFPTFTLRFEPYKDGITDVVIEWPELTEGDEELGADAFETVVAFSVSGEPPPIVESISIPDVMYRAGGQEITVVFDNTEESSLRVFKVGGFEYPEVPGSYRRLENGLYEVKFMTVPGNGTDIPWEVQVDFEEKQPTSSNISKPGVESSISYITVPLLIGAVQPPWGADSEQITLEGYFDGYDPNVSGHNIYIGEKSIAELGIVPSVDRENGRIILTAPTRSVAGAAYDYPIRVVVNEEETNTRVFSYIPESLSLNIEVLGGSFDNITGEYLMAVCEGSEYIASLPSGVRDPDAYEWRLIAIIGDVNDGFLDMSNLLDAFGVSTTSRSLTVQARAFRGRIGAFVVSASCVVYGQNQTANVTIRTTSVPVIGVSLSKIPTRTLARPNLPVRVDAIVTLPQVSCYDVISEVVYEWSFDGITRRFSYSSASIAQSENETRIGRLGRELIIPQVQLRYGTFPIFLLAYVSDAPFISGNSTTSLTVQRADLIAVIGSGAERVPHPLSSDLFLWAHKSENPDAIYDADGEITTYRWMCEVSRKISEVGPSDICPPHFIPTESLKYFTVSSESLRGLNDTLFSNPEQGSFFITFFLQVGNDVTNSSFVSQTIEIQLLSTRIPQLSDVTIVNGRGTAVDWRQIRFYDDLVIHLQAPGATWTFSVIAPKGDEGFIYTSGNLLKFDGFFNPFTTTQQALPLGIKGGKLRPAQTYRVEARLSFRDHVNASLAIIDFRTVDRPLLVLSPLNAYNGTTDTFFTASARVNLDSENPYSFFFFLVSDDGQETCVDGCSGRATVQFRILEAGDFILLVRLRDVEGTSVLDEQRFNTSITVSLSARTVSLYQEDTYLLSFESRLARANQVGDHSLVQQLASTFARQVQRSESNPANASFFITDAVTLMHRLVRNSVPTALTARSYIQTANQFVRISPVFFPVVDTLFLLLDMVDDTLLRVPVFEAIDVHADLLAFYNLSMVHAVEPFSRIYLDARVAALNRIRTPTERRNRLIETSLSQPSNIVSSDQQVFLIDLFLYMQRHLAVVLSRDAVCGSSISVSTEVPYKTNLGYSNSSKVILAPSRGSGGAFGVLNSFTRHSISLVSSFSMAIECESVQVDVVSGSSSSLQRCSNHTISGDAYEDIYPSPSESPEFDDESSFNTMTSTPSADLELSEKQVNVNASTNFSFPPRTLVSKQLFILQETVDYLWLGSLSNDDEISGTSTLLTISAPVISGRDIGLSTADNDCYVLNSSVPRLGLTETGGCFGSDGFSAETKILSDSGSSRRRLVTRKKDNVVAHLSRDGSSTVSMQSEGTGIIGIDLNDCPWDVEAPAVDLPEKRFDFQYTVIGAVVGAGTTITVVWAGSSASYASFTGAAAAV